MGSTPVHTPTDSSTDRADLALAEMMVAHGIIDRAQLEAALREQAARPGTRLTDILHELKLLRTPQAFAPSSEELAEIEERQRFGRFQLLRPLGSGGMGTVYQARDNETGRVLALKVFAPSDDWREYLADLTPQAFHNEVLREAEVIRRLHHPHIVHVFESGVEEGHAYIAMEYVPGGTLAMYRARLWSDRDLAIESTPVWSRPFLSHMRDIALGVDHAHDNGLLHRDIKPSNILATYESLPGGAGALASILNLKISDFGLALDLSGDAVRDPRVFGTPAYISPEQSRGRGYRFIPASDVWSLGVVLYEILTGVQPFDRDGLDDTIEAARYEEPPPPSRHNSALNPAVDRLVMTCLQKEMYNRFLTARELADALESTVQERPQAVGPPLGGPQWMEKMTERTAARGLKRWIGGKREHAEALFRRGVNRAGRGDVGGALADLTQTLQEFPDHAGARFHRAIALFAIGGFEQAVEDWNALIQARHDLAEAYVNRALALRRLSRYEEAVADLEEALKRAPPDWPHRGPVKSSLDKARDAWSAHVAGMATSEAESRPIIPPEMKQ